MHFAAITQRFSTLLLRQGIHAGALRRGFEPRCLEGMKAFAFEWLLAGILAGLLPSLAIPSCSYIISASVETADGYSNYAAVRPGDTVCIQGGVRGRLNLRNFQGTSIAPITFTNTGGQAVITSTEWVGLYVRNSRYFRITGTGDPSVAYGIRIAQSTNLGVNIADSSSDFEIDHVEVSGAPGQGITAKTEASCTLSRNTFTQYNTVIHDTYIHDVSDEGMYIGSSAYTGDKLVCNGVTQTVYPPVLRGVWIYNSTVVRTGQDGIQVGSAVENCAIHHNQISQDSQRNVNNQRSGMMINPGSVCDVYNNLIRDGAGRGIYVQGNGGNRIYNNLIIRPGKLETTDGHGITIATGSNTGQDIFVWNNTIISPHNVGIKFRNSKGVRSEIINNIVVAPGNLSVAGDAAYIDTGGRTNVVVSHNLKKATAAEVLFVNPTVDNYDLQAGSPAVDAGLSLSPNVPYDYAGRSRPLGTTYDIGAYEYAFGTFH